MEKIEKSKHYFTCSKLSITHTIASCEANRVNKNQTSCRKCKKEEREVMHAASIPPEQYLQTVQFQQYDPEQHRKRAELRQRYSKFA